MSSKQNFSSSTMVRNSFDRPNSPPWSVRTVRCLWLDLNFLRTLHAISIGGCLDFVRKSHMYLVALSTMIRYELYPSILVTVGPSLVFMV